MSESAFGALVGLSAQERDTLLAAAAECYMRREFQAAEDLLRGLLAIERDLRAVKLLAATLYQRGNHNAALELYEEAATRDPEDLYCRAGRVELLLMSLRFDEALPLAREILATDPQRKHPAVNRLRCVIETTCERLREAGSQR